MTKPEDMEEQIIETIDEDGNVIKFELLDIIEFENKEYGLLLPKDENDENDENEVILMRLIKEGEGESEEYVFEAIEDDDEFNKVVAYIDTLDEEE